MLTRNVNYEIPTLKKLITKCQKAQTECTRKETDYENLAAEFKTKYSEMCKQYGIEVSYDHMGLGYVMIMHGTRLGNAAFILIKGEIISGLQ